MRWSISWISLCVSRLCGSGTENAVRVHWAGLWFLCLPAAAPRPGTTSWVWLPEEAGINGGQTTGGQRPRCSKREVGLHHLHTFYCVFYLRPKVNVTQTIRIAVNVIQTVRGESSFKSRFKMRMSVLEEQLYCCAVYLFSLWICCRLMLNQMEQKQKTPSSWGPEAPRFCGWICLSEQ